MFVSPPYTPCSFSTSSLKCQHQNWTCHFSMQKTSQHQVSSARQGTEIIAVLPCWFIEGMSFYITISPLQTMLSYFFVMNRKYVSLASRLQFLSSYLQIINTTFCLAKLHFVWMDQTLKEKSVSTFINLYSSCHPLWWEATLYLCTTHPWDTP